MLAPCIPNPNYIIASTRQWKEAFDDPCVPFTNQRWIAGGTTNLVVSEIDDFAQNWPERGRKESC